MNCKKNLFFTILIVIAMSITFSSNAQVANEGMTVKTNNYHTIKKESKENIQFWKEYNNEDYYKHPEFGVLPSSSPTGNVVEDLSKRTSETRHYVDIDDPTVFYVQKGYFPINYLDTNNFWRAIETEVALVGNNIYESRYYYEPAGFDFNQNKSYIKTLSGKIDFNQWSLHKKIGQQIEFIAEPDWTNYSVGEDGVYIKSIFKGIDAEMIVRKGSIETNFIMKSNEFGVFDELIFRDNYASSQPLDISFSSNSGDSFGIGDVEVKKGGKPVLNMHEGVGYLLTDPGDRTALMYAINNQQVDVIVPFKWIDDNIKESSLVIDPLVAGVETEAMINILGSMYNASCNLLNSCDYDLTVVFPPFATIINTTTDFDYQAIGGCLLRDGATRFSSGTCISPTPSLVYWMCLRDYAGTCTGKEIPIYNDVKSCLPSPACVPQNIPFRLHFYRSCKGSTGCSNDCIAAFSDWSVTVTGKTLEFNNQSKPIDISETEICVGETVKVSTLGAWGVPPYTYNWSFSPTGVPSISTSSSEDITFSTVGTQKLYVTITDNCDRTVNDSVIIIVEDNVTPVFSSLGPYCTDQKVNLPTTSDNGVNGAWTPAFSTSTPGTKTFTFTSNGCNSSIDKEVTVIEAPNATISGDIEGCERDSIKPKIIFTGENTNAPYTFIYVIKGDTLQVSTSSSSNSATIQFPTDVSGTFIVELIQVLDEDCFRNMSKSFTVTIYESPIPDFIASAYSGQSGIEISFQNNSSGENSIEWFHFKGFLSNWGSSEDFSHIFNEPGVHKITLTAKNEHCESSITKTITILPNKASYNLPNIFTPNGDGINDFLDFNFENVEELDLVILNRWGNVVYQTNDPTESWNGKIENSGVECTDGTYFYKFTVKGPHGDEAEEHGFAHLNRNK